MIAQETVRQFAADGAQVIRGALTAPLIDQLRKGIDANLAAPGTHAKIASAPGDPGHFIEDFCCWQDNANYRAVIWQSGLAALAAALTGSDTVRLYHDHMLTKAAGTRQPTPWHQDQPYYNIEGRQTVSFWIPADPVPRESSLEFIAGSHLGPWLMPRTFMDNEAKWFPAGSLAELPAVDADPLRYRVLGWAVEPGDVIAFNMLSLHRAAGSQTQRRVLSLRFIGDDVRHAPRRWRTSPQFEGLAERLPAGAPMDDFLFPLVWSGGRTEEMPQ